MSKNILTVTHSFESNLEFKEKYFRGFYGIFQLIWEVEPNVTTFYIILNIVNAIVVVKCCSINLTTYIKTFYLVFEVPVYLMHVECNIYSFWSLVVVLFVHLNMYMDKSVKIMFEIYKNTIFFIHGKISEKIISFMKNCHLYRTILIYHHIWYTTRLQILFIYP